MRAAAYPWNDRARHFSLLRLSIFLLLVAPVAWLAASAAAHALGPRPVTAAIHQTGLWAVRFLALTLAVTPLRHATRYNSLIGIRRMLGLGVLFYALLHLALYGLDQHGNLLHIASEIVRRVYLTIGFAALCGLIALGVTSTDRMVRRLGTQTWGRLHKLAYAIAALGTIHFFMQSKLDVTEPIIMGGIFTLLMLERLGRRLVRDPGPIQLAGLALCAASLTACVEAFWYSLKTGAPMLMILAANLDFSYAVRPAWFVLAAGVILLIARLARPLLVGRKQPARKSAAMPATPLPACGER